MSLPDAPATKQVITTRPVYRHGVYYEAGKKLVVGVEEKCRGWRDVNAPAGPERPVGVSGEVNLPKPLKAEAPKDDAKGKHASGKAY